MVRTTTAAAASFTLHTNLHEVNPQLTTWQGRAVTIDKRSNCTTYHTLHLIFSTQSFLSSPRSASCALFRVGDHFSRRRGFPERRRASGDTSDPAMPMFINRLYIDAGWQTSLLQPYARPLRSSRSPWALTSASLSWSAVACFRPFKQCTSHASSITVIKPLVSPLLKL